MNYLSKYKFHILALFLITVLYFLFRLPNLTLQPIFADEAIYIRWSQIMKAEPTLRFVSMQDGKTPLFMWVMAPLFKIFDDPLFAGRILSVFAGFGTLLGVLFLGWKFFTPRVGIWAAFFVAITPFIVFFDRMALVDSMLAAFSIWSLNFALLLMKYPRVDLAMFLGYFLGGALLTKTPAMFTVISLPATLWIFGWKDPKRQKKLVKIFALWVLTLAITFGIYNILRLGPGFSNLNSRNQDYVFSPFELIGRPFDPFIPHLLDLADWFPKMLTIPILLLVLGGVVLTVIQFNRIALVVLSWTLIPLIIEMFFLRTFTARYILSSIAPLLFLGAFFTDFLAAKLASLRRFNKLYVTVALAFLLLPLAAEYNYRVLTDPPSANLPRSERRGYLEDWTAGYGLKEIAQFLMGEAQKGYVVVGTDGSFGTLPDGLMIYLDKYSHTADDKHQIAVIGGKATISAQLKNAAKDHNTFFVLNGSLLNSDSNKLQVLKKYEKVPGPDHELGVITLFKVMP